MRAASSCSTSSRFERTSGRLPCCEHKETRQSELPARTGNEMKRETDLLLLGVRRNGGDLLAGRHVGQLQHAAANEGSREQSNSASESAAANFGQTKERSNRLAAPMAVKRLARGSMC
jgi:hypothetical protein